MKRVIISALDPSKFQHRKQASSLYVGDCVYDRDLDWIFTIEKIQNGNSGSLIFITTEGDKVSYDFNDILYLPY